MAKVIYATGNRAIEMKKRYVSMPESTSFSIAKIDANTFDNDDGIICLASENKVMFSVKDHYILINKDLTVDSTFRFKRFEKAFEELYSCSAYTIEDVFEIFQNIAIGDIVSPNDYVNQIVKLEERAMVMGDDIPQSIKELPIRMIMKDDYNESLGVLF